MAGPPSTHNACPCPSFRLLHGSAGWLPGADILRHIESTTTVETGRMRAARAMPVGRSATKAARAFSSERRTACGAVVGKPEGAGASRTGGAASLVGVCVTRCGRPSGVRGSGSAALGQSLACQPLPFRWKVGDLRALRLAALAVLGRVLVPGPAVTTPALAGVHLLGHSAPLSQVLLSVCVYTASGDAHIPSRQDGTALDNDDRGPRTSVVGRDFLQLTWGWSSADDGVLPRHRRSSTGCYRAGGPPLPTGSGAGWYVLDADVGEPGRNHNGVPVGAARVALGMIAVRPPGRPPHSGEAGGSRQCGRSR
jgi:hypothetical protein